MGLEMTEFKKPFRKSNLDQKLDTFTVRLNVEERERLNYVKKILRQPKDSTAMKQLSEVGYNVLHTPQTVHLLDLVFKNRKNNARLGILDEDENFTK